MSLSSLQGNIIAFDTETTGLNPWNSHIYQKYKVCPARPFAFSFCDTEGNTAYIRWEVDPFTRKVIPNYQTQKEMSEILNDPSIVKIGHNLMFDIRMSRMSGIKFNWSHIHDTQFMTHVYTGGGLRTYALKALCQEFLGFSQEDQDKLLLSVKKNRKTAKQLGWKIANEEIYGKHFIKADYWLADKSLCKKYAIQDAERTMLLYLGFKEKFDEHKNLQLIYQQEIDLSKVVYHIEKRGIQINKKHLIYLKNFYREYAERWLKKSWACGGKSLNFNSPKQMVEKFCKEKGYTVRKRTKSGKPSIDNTELQRLATKDQLAKAILEYKGAMGMITKFIQPYERFMVKKGVTWSLHPNFKQCGPITGRFSCSDPNLMQVADENSFKQKADISLKPREMFKPRLGYVWYLPDYSQMEVWVFAFQAQDKMMTEALLSGKDFHSETAHHVWSDEEDYEEQKSMYRKKGKTMMFLKQYGGGSKAGSELLDCSRQEAQQIIDKFDERIPGVSMFLEKISYQAASQGEIKNVFGREYSIDIDKSYKAVNYLVQGTCADMMKRSMIGLFHLFQKKYQGCHILLTLHDELIIEVPIQLHSTQLQQDIILVMQQDSQKVGIPISMPITMKMTNTRWSDAREI